MAALFRRSAGFHGGLKLPGNKLHGERGRIAPAPIPERLVLPLSQHIGAPTQAKVKVGDRVRRGQTLAASDGFIAAPIHASTSGTVVAIEDVTVPHPSGLRAPAIILEADGEDAPLEQPEWPAAEDPFTLDPQTVRERVRAAGLVGLGGAAFPSAVKLNPGRSAVVDTLVLNGAECEPYISCDAALMVERADDVVRGAELVRRTLGAHECLIGIEDNAPEAATALREAAHRAGFQQIQIRVVATRYPQGGEKQLIQTLTGKEVPSEGLPLDIGIVVQNVGTAAALWRALRYAEPLTSRVITVTGPGLTQPRNLQVRLGTPVADLIAHCGGTTQEQVRLIMGGPMMGFTLPDDAVPVIKGTNCILVDTYEPEPVDAALPCIRCGECVDVCPAQLLPQQLYWHARAKEFDKAQSLNLFDCIECGCCAQVCPSHIPLVQYYRFAKTEIYHDEQERRKADIARARHEFRQERLEREQREKEEARRRKREALKTTTPPAAENAAPAPAAQSDVVAAAIAKAKAEKAQRQASGEGGNAAADAIAAAKAAQQAKSGGNPADDAIARAKAKAKNKDAGESSQAAATAAIEKAKKAKAERGEGSASANDAIARAKAAAAEKKAGSATSTGGAADAIAKAKAAAAKKAETPDGGDQSGRDTPSSDKAADAIARAKEAAAAKSAQAGQPAGGAADAIAKAKAAAKAKSGGQTEADTRDKRPAATSDDPVAAAIAKAKAARAQKDSN